MIAPMRTHETVHFNEHVKDMPSSLNRRVRSLGDLLTMHKRNASAGDALDSPDSLDSAFRGPGPADRVVLTFKARAHDSSPEMGS